MSAQLLALNCVNRAAIQNFNSTLRQ